MIFPRLRPLGALRHYAHWLILFLSFCCLQTLQAQTAEQRISGKVISDAQKPLVGVSVKVVGTGKGTVTGADGDFSLLLKDGDKVEFSYLGHVSKVIKFTGQKSLDVFLSASSEQLDNVVVTGFQNIDRKKFTGAAVTLKADSIKIDGITDISRMLEGRAAGVSIQNVSGTFGSAPKIRVRGATSISGENKPLWVVDGVVLEDVVNVSNDQLSSGDASTLLGSSVAGLNANDIETFDILKDASAAALYGARAMNGVIVITTKKGKAGRSLISYVGNFGMQLKPSYSTYDIMNSADQMSVYSEIERKGFLNFPDLVNARSSGVFGKLAQLLQTPDANGNFAVQNTTAARQAYLMQYANGNTDWFNILFKNSVTQEHSLSISSGTDKVQSYFSTSLFSDPGWDIASSVKRYTATMRNNYVVSNKLSFGFSVNGSVRQQNAPGTDDRKSDPVQGTYSRDFDLNPFSYALNTSRVLPAYNSDGSLAYFTRNYAPFNILDETKQNYTKLGIVDVKLQGNLSYKITPHITYDFLGALRYVKTTEEHDILDNANEANAYRANGTSIINGANPFLYKDPSNPNLPAVVVLPYGGFYKRTDRQLTNYTFRNVLSYNNLFNDKKHQLTALLGQELRSIDRQTANNLGIGYQYGNGGNPFSNYLFFKKMNELDSNYYGMSNEYDHFVAFFANAQYTYNNRYTIMSTIRVDGSNKLGLSAKTRWLPTWTVAGVWNIDQEKFMDDVRFVSHWALKASYGLNASTGEANNSTAILKSSTTARLYAADQQPSIYIQDLQNADLTWEKKYEFNVESDMGFFNERLNMTVDYYKRHSFNLIGSIKTSGIGGQTTQFANYMDMSSHGIDVSITGKIVAQKNFSITSTFNMGYNITNITNAKNTPTIFALVGEGGGAKEGYAVRGLFSLQNAGLDPGTNNILTSGVANFINENGGVSHAVNLQTLSTQYLQYEGAADPTFTGGWYNTFRYKQFSVAALFTFQAGNKVRLTPQYSSTYSDLSSLPNSFKGRYTLPGDEKLTNIPSVADLFSYVNTNNALAYPYSNYNFSHDRVADGGFVRMKSVTVSYQLSSVFINHLGLKSGSISLTGNNLWLVYSDKYLYGQDPEFFNTGGVALPVNKQITASLKLGL